MPQSSKPPGDLFLIYKGKIVALLTEAEIANNTHDGLVESGYLIDNIVGAIRELGVFDDLYHPERSNTQ